MTIAHIDMHEARRTQRLPALNPSDPRRTPRHLAEDVSAAVAQGPGEEG